MDAGREVYWQRKLGTVRIGAEPIAGQLRQRFWARVVLSVLSGIIALIFLAIFAGFGRLDLGVKVVGILLAPGVAWAWLDFAILRWRVASYLRERDSL